MDGWLEKWRGFRVLGAILMYDTNHNVLDEALGGNRAQRLAEFLCWVWLRSYVGSTLRNLVSIRSFFYAQKRGVATFSVMTIHQMSFLVLWNVHSRPRSCAKTPLTAGEERRRKKKKERKKEELTLPFWSSAAGSESRASPGKKWIDFFKVVLNHVTLLTLYFSPGEARLSEPAADVQFEHVSSSSSFFLLRLEAFWTTNSGDQRRPTTFPSSFHIMSSR